MDVSESALDRAGKALLAERPGLVVHGLIADFQHPPALPESPGPRLVAFLGGTNVAAAGLALRRWWTDAKGRFALSLAFPTD